MLCDEGEGGGDGATLIVKLLLLVLCMAGLAAPLTPPGFVPPAIAVLALVACVAVVPFHLAFITNVGPCRAFVTPHLPSLWAMGWTLAMSAWKLGLGGVWGGLDSRY